MPRKYNHRRPYFNYKAHSYRDRVNGNANDRAISPLPDPESPPKREPFHVGQTVYFYGDFWQHCSGTIKKLNNYEAQVKTTDLGTGKQKVIPTPLNWLRHQSHI